jgi:uncharacterized protein with GYD domain
MPTYILLSKWTDQGVQNVKESLLPRIAEQSRGNREARRAQYRGVVHTGRI